PVAFLVTEIVEVAMLADPRGKVLIALQPADRPDRATLSIAAAALAGAPDRPSAPSERFRRVIEGLSRQLRSKLAIDEILGSYAIEISISPDTDDD
ncbi:MAG TPA: sensor histidine kinase, partial [Sphingomonas sp.]